MNINQRNNIVLEDGYNSDYIYSMITALFYTPNDGTNKMINSDTSSIDTFYIQEYIKTKFVYPIHRSLSIESGTVNKFRLFLYNCGWMKDNSRHILEKAELDKFYQFLIANMMEYNIRISKIDQDSTKSIDLNVDLIRIDDSLLEEDEKTNKVINLSSLVERWVKREISDQSISYKFAEIPYILPIYIDMKDQDTGLNKRYINVMEGINFSDIGDKIQSMLIWEIHSLICQNEKGDYYSIVIDHNDDLMGFSDKSIPSNWRIDVTNLVSVKKIMREVKFVFYKLQ